MISTPDPETFAVHLDGKVAAHLAQIQQSEVFQLVADPTTDGRLVTAIVKYVLLEIFSCGPHITEATFAAISRLPKHRPDLMKPMVLHDLSEVDHGEMALRDYVRLGGDEAWARSRRITPASLAMSATCRMIGERESPFAYLGYMYLLESLTPALTAWVQTVLRARGFPTDAQVFIDVHAVEDIEHSRELRDLIVRVLDDYPEATEAIEYGFDCFAQVFPLPIWAAALQHARSEIGARE
jgi:hypothetical protein